jgi:hypothetical protein
MEKDRLIEVISEATVNAYKYEYDKILANWTGIETKAQTTITIAGIFIAALVAFLHDAASQIDRQRGFLFVAAIFLLGAVMAASFVLLLKEVPRPPQGNKLFPDVLDNIEAVANPNNSDASSLLSRFYRYQIIVIDEVIKELKKVLDKKRGQLRIAQGFLLLGIVISGLYLLAKMMDS